MKQELKPCAKVELKTKQGESFFVDSEDVERLSQYTWGKYKSCRYVSAYINGKSTGVHRFIMNAQDGSYIDHIDGNPMNNQKSNLRFCSMSENMCNRKNNSGGKTTPYKGVHRLSNGRFRVNISRYRQKISLGVFTSLRDAVLSYNAGARVLHGDFANLNAIPSNDEDIALLKEEIKRLKTINGKLNKTISHYQPTKNNITMIKKYYYSKYITNAQIKVVEVVRETPQFVILQNGDREAKNSHWWFYANTFEEAKALILEKEEQNLEHLRKRLESTKESIISAISNIEKIKNLTEQNNEQD